MFRENIVFLDFFELADDSIRTAAQILMDQNSKYFLKNLSQRWLLKINFNQLEA